jgi:hypothetical protein
MMNSAELRARILAEAKKTPAPTRAEHQKRVAIVVVLGTLATAVLFFAMGGFAPGARPAELIGFTAGFAFVAALILTKLSAQRRGSMLPPARPLLATLCIVAAPVLAIAVLAATFMFPAHTDEDVPTKTHLACGFMTVVQGALPLLVLVLPRRSSDPVHPVLTGAALGMTAGAWTAAMAYLRCPHAAASHCILAHVAPTLVLTVIGALLGRIFLRVRA